MVIGTYPPEDDGFGAGALTTTGASGLTILMAPEELLVNVVLPTFIVAGFGAVVEVVLTAGVLIPFWANGLPFISAKDIMTTPLGSGLKNRVYFDWC